MKYKKLFEERYDGRVRGKWFRMQCPYHEEKDGSLDVDINQGGFHCFGCSKTGNIVELISKIEQVSQSQAALIISKYCTKVSQIRGRLGERIPVTSEVAQIQYLDEEQTLNQFVPIQDTNYLKYIKARKIKQSLIPFLDLRQGSRIRRGWDDKIVYGIRNLAGDLVSIEGRTIKENDPLRFMKWTGSNASHGLLGIDKLFKKDFTKPLFVVEGLFDVLSVYSCSFRAVGMQCSELSAIQLSQLRKVTEYPIVLLDGQKQNNNSKAERKRIKIKLYKLLRKKGFLKYKVVEIPYKDTDPNDLLKQNKLKNYLKGLL